MVAAALVMAAESVSCSVKQQAFNNKMLPVTSSTHVMHTAQQGLSVLICLITNRAAY